MGCSGLQLSGIGQHLGNIRSSALSATGAGTGSCSCATEGSVSYDMFGTGKVTPMAEEHILVIEGDEEFVQCPTCEGTEGWAEGDEWHICADCEGEGGHWRKRITREQEESMARTWIATGGRQSGRTTRAMQELPKGAVFVWVNQHLDYPKQLARKLGRDDLQIVSPQWLVDRRWTGLDLTGLNLDHAAREVMTDEQCRAYQEAMTRVRSAQRA